MVYINVNVDLNLGPRNNPTFNLDNPIIPIMYDSKYITTLDICSVPLHKASIREY
jgi:hypothetical protein